MTRLNPTPEELRLAHAARLADQAQREERWRQRRRRFVRGLALAGAVLLLVSARLAAFGGTMDWPAWLLLLAAGAAMGWCIAGLGLGILRGMLLYGGGAFLAWLACFMCDWWQLAGANGMLNAGPLILMIMAWLAWIVIGGVLGMLSEQFDSDHVHI